jgi:uncharacterized lipoprotein YajG
MQSWFRSLPLVASLVAAALLGACAGTATTQVTLTPPDQAPVCQPQAALKASVLWRTQWRADQKDVPDHRRHAAAEQVAVAVDVVHAAHGRPVLAWRSCSWPRG